MPNGDQNISLRLSLVPFLVLLALACTDSNSPEQPLVITPAIQTLRVPRTLQISTEGGRGTVSWESSDRAVATVDTSGLVTAMFPGSAAITARQGLRSATLTLTVTATRIDIAPSPASVALNGTQPLTATARDANGAVLSGVPVSWRTGNAAIARVDSTTGVVTGIATGATTITAIGGGASGGVTVVVRPPDPVVVSLSLLPSAFTIIAGGVEHLIARGYDSAGRPTSVLVEWSSADPAVATVGKTDGIITAISVGTTTVTAVVGTLRATATVSVVSAIATAGNFAFTRMTQSSSGIFTSDVLVFSVADRTTRSLPRPSQFASIAAPAWSADRTRLAVEAIQVFFGPPEFEWLDYNSDLYVLDAAAPADSPWRALTANGLSKSPSWSPDGKRIAYLQQQALHSYNHIYIIDAAGGTPVRLTQAEGWYSSPRWSPDGTRLAFSVFLEGSGHSAGIFIVNADGSGLTNVTRSPAYNADPSWSPDGARLAFVSLISKTAPGPAHFGVSVVDIDGNNVRNLTSLNDYTSAPAWSPDGRQIIFSSGSALYLINADGSSLVRLTRPPLNFWDSAPAWKP